MANVAGAPLGECMLPRAGVRHVASAIRRDEWRRLGEQYQLALEQVVLLMARRAVRQLERGDADHASVQRVAGHSAPAIRALGESERNTPRP